MKTIDAGGHGLTGSRAVRRRALLYIAVLVAVLLSACLINVPGNAQAKLEGSSLLQRIFATADFKVKSFGPARWLDRGEAYTTLEPSTVSAEVKDIVRYATESGKREVMVSASRLVPADAKNPLLIEDYAWSTDMKRVLIYTNSARVWRQNTRGDYWVLDRETNRLRKLGGDAPPATLMFAKFAPDGRRVAYVRANNLFVEDVETGAILQLTRDGSETTINGTSDWVYEEEFDIRDGFRWSPDGRKIAFWQFDTRGVGNFPLIYDLGSMRKVVTSIPYPEIGIYPAILNVPYPQPGTTNSAARVGVVSAEGGQTRWMEVSGDPRNNYIARMEWAVDSREMLLQHLNRLQNTDDVLLADAETGAVRQVYRDQDSAWVDVVDEVRWLHGGAEFLWLSERDGWRHVYRVSRDGKHERVVTQGAFDVVSVQGIEETGGWLYYIASPENATERYLYRTRLDGTGQPERVTPSEAPGTHSYNISPDCRWAFHTYSRFDLPPVTDLVQVSDHHTVRVLEDNAGLRSNAAPLLTMPTEFFRIDIGGGVTLDGWMIKPPDFDPEKKYPILIYVYGEPASQAVMDQWARERGLFHRVVARAGYLVASVDNRGTPAPKGRAWRKVIYGAIGVLNSKEQAAALLALERTRPYIDSTRVAVWGWSGGGTSTLNLLFRSPELYKVGMSVAPVPDLRLYDTVYQERYMRLPQQNLEGYRDSSPINFAEGLRGKLLLVHGSGDDNVHFQGSELLINRLIELGKPFDFMEYPNRTHAISEGKGTSLHLYSLLLRYLEEHLPAGPVTR